MFIFPKDLEIEGFVYDESLTPEDSAYLKRRTREMVIDHIESGRVKWHKSVRLFGEVVTQTFDLLGFRYQIYIAAEDPRSIADDHVTRIVKLGKTEEDEAGVVVVAPVPVLYIHPLEGTW